MCHSFCSTLYTTTAIIYALGLRRKKMAMEKKFIFTPSFSGTRCKVKKRKESTHQRKIKIYKNYRRRAIRVVFPSVQTNSIILFRTQLFSRYAFLKTSLFYKRPIHKQILHYCIHYCIFTTHCTNFASICQLKFGLVLRKPTTFRARSRAK